MATSEQDRAALLARLFADGGVPEALSKELMRTRDVARAFQVSERTVAEWARRGRIPWVRTPGGHRLYPAQQIRELLEASQGEGARLDGLAPSAAQASSGSPGPVTAGSGGPGSGGPGSTVEPGTDGRTTPPA